MTVFNHEIAEKLRDIAYLLEAQHANPFRSRAYQNAANTVDQLEHDVKKLVQENGINSLISLPTIGAGIAQSIYEYVAIGRMTRLEKLKGTSDPVALFQSIPTVGKELAKRIHDTLHVDSLEALENAAHKNQLSKVEGLGLKRKQAIEAWLSKHLGDHRRQLRAAKHSIEEPTINLLLKIDAEYRNKANASKLPFITPKRFNPNNKAWLPVLHSSRDHWHFTALYSNTERAHKLNRVYDWVVIYFYDDHHQEGQHTVVTETHGTLIGKRVVRGREADCIEFYETQNQWN